MIDFFDVFDYFRNLRISTGKVNDSADFAYARLGCLNVPVARPARAAKVTSDFLYSSLHGDLCIWMLAGR